MLHTEYNSGTSKNFPFLVNSTIELKKNVTTIFDKNDIQRGIFRLRNVPVLSDVAVTFFFVTQSQR